MGSLKSNLQKWYKELLIGEDLLGIRLQIKEEFQKHLEANLFFSTPVNEVLLLNVVIRAKLSRCEGASTNPTSTRQDYETSEDRFKGLRRLCICSKLEKKNYQSFFDRGTKNCYQSHESTSRSRTSC